MLERSQVGGRCRAKETSVTQDELKQFVRLRATAQSRDTAKRQLVKLLEADATVEPGDLSAWIEILESKRLTWSAIELAIGEDEANRLLRRLPHRVSFRMHIEGDSDQRRRGARQRYEADPRPIKRISQMMLAEFLDIARIARMARGLTALRTSLRSSLLKGGTIEPGPLTVNLVQYETIARSRQDLRKILGKKTMDRLLVAIRPSESVRLHISDSLGRILY
jgi:hypothetical protein